MTTCVSHSVKLNEIWVLISMWWCRLYLCYLSRIHLWKVSFWCSCNYMVLNHLLWYQILDALGCLLLYYVVLVRISFWQSGFVAGFLSLNIVISIQTWGRCCPFHPWYLFVMLQFFECIWWMLSFMSLPSHFELK